MNYSIQRDQTIILKEKNGLKQVCIDSISHIICNSYISTVYYYEDSKRPETYTKLLKDFEAELTDYGFIRINHNTIVNVKYFNSLKKEQKRCIVLETGEEFIVSRRKWTVFKKKLEI